MSRLIASLFVLLALLLGAMPLAAQEDPMLSDCTVARPGDSFWRIADYHLTNDQWKKLWEKNPTTQNGKPRRFFKNPTNGWSYVHIDKGETICGLKEIGVVPTIATPEELTKMGLGHNFYYQTEVVPTWLWWLLGLIALLALAYWLYSRRLNRPGATAGPAFVPGGVAATGTDPGQLFQEHAARQYEARTGMVTTPIQIRITDRVAGRIWGVLETLYNGGRSETHRYNGDRAYLATVTYPDGRMQETYMLDACGNPLIYGWVTRYVPGPDFRFEADPVQAPAPTPEPVVAQPEPVPAAQVAPTPEPAPPTNINPSGEFVRPTDAPPAVQNGHEDLLRISFRPEENGKDSLVQAEGVDVERFTFEKNGNSITFRFREAKTNK